MLTWCFVTKLVQHFSFISSHTHSSLFFYPKVYYCTSRTQNKKNPLSICVSISLFENSEYDNPPLSRRRRTFDHNGISRPMNTRRTMFPWLQTIQWFPPVTMDSWMDTSRPPFLNHSWHKPFVDCGHPQQTRGHVSLYFIHHYTLFLLRMLSPEGYRDKPLNFLRLEFL